MRGMDSDKDALEEVREKGKQKEEAGRFKSEVWGGKGRSERTGVAPARSAQVGTQEGTCWGLKPEKKRRLMAGSCGEQVGI